MYENEFKKQGLLNLRAKTRQKSLKIKFTQPNGKDFKQQNKFCDEGFCCDLIEKTILSKKANLHRHFDGQLSNLSHL